MTSLLTQWRRNCCFSDCDRHYVMTVLWILLHITRHSHKSPQRSTNDAGKALGKDKKHKSMSNVR